MIFYCAFCSTPLKTGTMICQCGQIFPHPVPVEGNQIGASYWPPRHVSPVQEQARQARSFWDGINPATKAIIAGAVAVILMGFAVVTFHSPFTPHTAPTSAVYPRTTLPTQAVATPQPVVPAMPAPVVLTRPSPPIARTNANYGSGNAASSPGNEIPIQQQINALESQKSSLIQEKMSLLMEEQTARQQGDETTAGMKDLDVNTINADIGGIDAQLRGLRQGM